MSGYEEVLLSKTSFDLGQIGVELKPSLFSGGHCMP
jgi:hypothetical protein